MLPRDLELCREIGLAHILAKSYRSQHFSECEGPAGQLLEKLLGIDRAVGIPQDLLLPLRLDRPGLQHGNGGFQPESGVGLPSTNDSTD